MFDDFFSFTKAIEREDYMQNINLDVTEDDTYYNISADIAGMDEKEVLSQTV